MLRPDGIGKPFDMCHTRNLYSRIAVIPFQKLRSLLLAFVKKAYLVPVKPVFGREGRPAFQVFAQIEVEG